MLPSEVNEQVRRGMSRMEEGPESAMVEADDETRQMPSPGVMLGVGMAIVGLGVLGWLIYRSRRRETFLKQLRGALPISMDELRDEVGSRLQRVRSRYSR